jgi:hypothetical protein
LHASVCLFVVMDLKKLEPRARFALSLVSLEFASVDVGVCLLFREKYTPQETYTRGSCRKDRKERKKGQVKQAHLHSVSLGLVGVPGGAGLLRGLVGVPGSAGLLRGLATHGVVACLGDGPVR